MIVDLVMLMQLDCVTGRLGATLKELSRCLQVWAVLAGNFPQST